MSENNNISFSTWFKGAVSSYTDFLNTLSTGKFIFFLLILMISGGITGDITGGHNFFPDLAALLAFISIGIKVLNNRKSVVNG